MDKTFDYNQIDVDDVDGFDDFYDFFPHNEKKKINRISKSYFSDDYYDYDMKDAGENSTIHKEGVGRSKREMRNKDQHSQNKDNTNIKSVNCSYTGSVEKKQEKNKDDKVCVRIDDRREIRHKGDEKKEEGKEEVEVDEVEEIEVDEIEVDEIEVEEVEVEEVEVEEVEEEGKGKTVGMDVRQNVRKNDQRRNAKVIDELGGNEQDGISKKKKKNHNNQKHEDTNSFHVQNSIEHLYDVSNYDDNLSSGCLEYPREDYDLENKKKKRYEERDNIWSSDSNSNGNISNNEYIRNGSNRNRNSNNNSSTNSYSCIGSNYAERRNTNERSKHSNNNSVSNRSRLKKKEEKLKYYRCRYCEIDSIDSVVQCNTCDRWFCNGSYGTCGSHIVTHLVRSKHKEIKLHKNSLLGETILECYNCGCRNVFLLGFLPTSEEGVVVIICRDPCLARFLSLYGRSNARENEDDHAKEYAKEHAKEHAKEYAKEHVKEYVNDSESTIKKGDIGKKQELHNNEKGVKYKKEQQDTDAHDDNVRRAKNEVDITTGKNYIISSDEFSFSEDNWGQLEGKNSMHYDSYFCYDKRKKRERKNKIGKTDEKNVTSDEVKHERRKRDKVEGEGQRNAERGVQKSGHANKHDVWEHDQNGSISEGSHDSINGSISGSENDSINGSENDSINGSGGKGELAELGKMKEWNLKKWQPLIEDRCFLDWLVSIPSVEEAEKKGKKLATSYNVNKLEELWKNKKDVYIDELDSEILNDEPVKVALKYDDVHHYQSIFAPLIKLEADYDKSIKEGQKQGNVTIRWDIGLNKKRYAHFIYVKEESELRLVAGDELKLSYTYPNGKVWSCEGHISRLHNTEEIALELRILGTADGPWVDNITTGFSVEFVWKSTAYDRMLLALNEFAYNSYSLSGYLYHKLLGHDISDESLEYYKNDLVYNNSNSNYHNSNSNYHNSNSNYHNSNSNNHNSNNHNSNNHNSNSNYNMHDGKRRGVLPIVNYSAPNLAPLNHSQIDAIKKSLLSPLSLIQGPPGTGKTLTCATLVYHLSTMRKGGKVLVTAPSNVAVDQLSVRIHRTGLKVVRLCAKSRESVPSIADYLYLHNQMKLLKSDIGEELNKLLELKEEVGELSQKDERRLKKLIFYAEQEILIEADVICSTCVGAMDKRLKKFRFSQVLVDEATQSTEPECLVPLVTGAKQIVLVGDHCQLGPIIVCKKAANAGLGKSLFERLVMLGITPFRLEVQYRMHPALSEFPSYVFYDGCLQNGITLKEREYPLKNFPWPNPKCPMFFYNTAGLEEMSASGTSYLNRSEASNMEKLVRTLLQCGLKANQIGVITPYEGQRAYITSLLQKNLPFQHASDIEVASVDAFQGREKDFILLSCVRSNKKLGIGFLNDPRRLNVALTRAKYGLIICGNAKVLSRQHYITKEKINSNETITNVNSVWINLLTQFKKKDLIVEGCLSNLKLVTITIPTPVKQPSRYINFNYFEGYERVDKGRALGSTSFRRITSAGYVDNLYGNSRITNYNHTSGNYDRNNDKFNYNSGKNRKKFNSNISSTSTNHNNNISYINMNMSNHSYCNDSVMNKDFFSFMNNHPGSKHGLNSYINNMSQLSQLNDYSVDNRNLLLSEGGKLHDVSFSSNEKYNSSVKNCRSNCGSIYDNNCGSICDNNGGSICDNSIGNNPSNPNFLYYNNNLTEDKNMSNNSVDLNCKEGYYNLNSKNCDIFPQLFYYKNNQSDNFHPSYQYANETNENRSLTLAPKKFKNKNVMSSSEHPNMLLQDGSVLVGDFKLSGDPTQDV
ncbi:regulator of nonsense transcripts 1, putative [Plasmodium malariae]|uniref:Regulator of nonsense transcripts 1, putative n=1 Tax=Plasmodium malariae TaxID=5858 RepID=A0A1C3KY05_PLAMA|nr:regulator of nonsense transcripts 1, putative [Plasmodium malariae]